MITIKNLIEIANGLSDEFSLKMSNHNKEYTFKNSKCAHNGRLYYNGYEFEFDIDWNDKRKFTLRDLNQMLEKYKLEDLNVEITSFDSDDGNTIHFENILVIEEDVILV